ncbi:MAG: AAA family ATPase [Arachnia sp.]
MMSAELYDEQHPSRRASITWACNIEPEPVTWMWVDAFGGRIPAGSLSVAAGREGTGKSSFGMWLAAQITTGKLPGAFYGIPRRVFYVAVEDSWSHTIVPRLIAAGADLSMVGRFDVLNDLMDDVTLSLPVDNELLETAILDHEVALVVIDPLMSVMKASIDTHQGRQVRTALDPLVKIADRTRALMLGIAHFNKSSGTDAASLITGSGEFKNVPRSVFGFARDENDDGGGRVMSQVKNSLGRDDLPSMTYIIEPAEVETRKGPASTSRFAFTGNTDRSVGDILRDSGRDSDELDERDEASRWLLDYLHRNGGAVVAGDAIKAAAVVGIAKTTLTRARKRSKVYSSKSGMEGGWVWTTDDTEESTKGPPSKYVDSSVPSSIYMDSSVVSGPFEETEETEETEQSGHGPFVDSSCSACGEPLNQSGSLSRCRDKHEVAA